MGCRKGKEMFCVFRRCCGVVWRRAFQGCGTTAVRPGDVQASACASQRGWDETRRAVSLRHLFN
jgi:hypothetical protein